MKSCLLTIIAYLLAIQCIKLFNYVCFNAFGPFLARAMLRRLSTGGFRDCRQHASQTGKGPRQDGSALC